LSPSEHLESLLSRYQGRKEDLLTTLRSEFQLHPVLVAKASSEYAAKSWRYAWLCYHLFSPGDMQLRAALPQFIALLEFCPEGQQREILRILEREQLPETLSGTLFDQTCLIWEAVDKRPGVRILAFRILAKIARKYPDLGAEIKAYDQSHYTASLSPGIYHSFRKLIASL